MTDELTKKDSVESVTIGGKEYKLSPVNWDVLSSIERELGCGINEIQPLLESQPFSTTLKLAWIFLADNNPELTKDKIGKISNNLDIAGINDAIATVISKFFKGES